MTHAQTAKLLQHEHAVLIFREVLAAVYREMKGEAPS
jgi:hypothetical protein